MSSIPYVLEHHHCDEPDGTVFRVETRAGERFDTAEITPLRPSGEMEWFWPGRIAVGKVTVIEGAPGSGKTRVVFDLASRVGGGLLLPDGTPNPMPAADVLLISRHEEASAAVVSRFDEPGEYPRQLLCFSDFWTEAAKTGKHGPRPIAFPFDLEALESYLDYHAAVRMVIIDPLSDFCATPKLMAETLHRLDDVARRCQIALVVTVPSNCRTNAQGRLRVTSRWPTEAARSVWCIVSDPEDPSRRLFVARRTNFCAEPDGLAFRIDASGVAWETDSAISPDDPLGKLSDAERSLEEFLSDGPLPANTVFRLGAEQGMTQNELRAAGKRLKVKNTRIGFSAGGHWEWSLAAQEADSSAGQPLRRVAEKGPVEDVEPLIHDVAAGPEGPACDGIRPIESGPHHARSDLAAEGLDGLANVPRLPDLLPTLPNNGTVEDVERLFQAVAAGHESGSASHVKPLSKRKAKKARRRLARQRAAELQKTAGVVATAPTGCDSTAGSEAQRERGSDG
jgi:hypothetical protein